MMPATGMVSSDALLPGLERRFPGLERTDRAKIPSAILSTSGENRYQVMAQGIERYEIWVARMLSNSSGDTAHSAADVEETVSFRTYPATFPELGCFAVERCL